MTSLNLKIAALGALALSVPAFAPAVAQESNVYVNGGYTAFDGDGGADLGAITGRAGVGFGQYFAVEGEASFGVKDDGGLDLDNELGLFGVGVLPINERVNLFARAGWARIETSPGGDEDGAAYGVGANFFFTDHDGIRLDATRHDYDAGNVDAYSVSYVRRF
ncbi:MAG: outer membrane beta-barrel protein [Hyphomonadaceae bacterium]